MTSIPTPLQLNYRPTEQGATAYCGTCQFLDHGGNVLTCTVTRLKVGAFYVCDRFQPIEPKEAVHDVQDSDSDQPAELPTEPPPDQEAGSAERDF